MYKFVSTMVVLIVATFSFNCATAQSSVEFDAGKLTVATETETHAFEIEIADTVEETSRGLMFRESMDVDHGMLFDFGEPRNPSMWMKNTLIPLDILFMDETGYVVAIAHNAQPHSERHLSPGMPVKGVLELNGGTAKSLGIEPGSVVHHEIFNNVQQTAAIE